MVDYLKIENRQVVTNFAFFCLSHCSGLGFSFPSCWLSKVVGLGQSRVVGRIVEALRTARSLNSRRHILACAVSHCTPSLEFPLLDIARQFTFPLFEGGKGFTFFHLQPAMASGVWLDNILRPVDTSWHERYSSSWFSNVPGLQRRSTTPLVSLDGFHFDVA